AAKNPASFAKKPATLLPFFLTLGHRSLANTTSCMSVEGRKNRTSPAQPSSWLIPPARSDGRTLPKIFACVPVPKRCWLRPRLCHSEAGVNLPLVFQQDENGFLHVETPLRCSRRIQICVVYFRPHFCAKTA